MYPVPIKFHLQNNYEMYTLHKLYEHFYACRYYDLFAWRWIPVMSVYCEKGDFSGGHLEA